MRAKRSPKVPRFPVSGHGAPTTGNVVLDGGGPRGVEGRRHRANHLSRNARRRSPRCSTGARALRLNDGRAPRRSEVARSSCLTDRVYDQP
ncbi:hypothetical protein HBB16_08320 [Pseudonocardia sp. MCCB 268]|nr:hypothetical protein [Pseudonocardia cytotoxica]